jgi:hypothetical protein
VNSAINTVSSLVGVDSTDVAKGLDTMSTILDGAALAIDTAIATGDVISGAIGTLTGGFASIPEGGAAAPAGGLVAMGAFELNPITRGVLTANNVLWVHL